MAGIDDAQAGFEAWCDAFLGADATVEMRRNARAAFTSMCERMDLVTRAEFDAQRQALDTAVRKLEEIERRLVAAGMIEAAADAKPDGAASTGASGATSATGGQDQGQPG